MPSATAPPVSKGSCVRGRRRTSYARSRANQTVELAPKPSLPTIW